MVAVPLALDHVGLAPESRLIISLTRWPLLLAILLGALGMLYRVRSEPAACPLAMARRRNARRGIAVDRGLGAVVVVPVEFCQLQRNLRLARRRHRPDDVDVDVGHHRALWRPN